MTNRSCTARLASSITWANVRGLAGVVVASLAALGCSSGPSDGPESSEEVGVAAQAATTCVTLRRDQGATVNDAWVYSLNPTTNYALAVGLKVSSGATQARALYRWDFGSIPSNAIVSSATLTLMESANTTAQTMEIHRILGPWLENTVTFSNFLDNYDPTITTSFTAPATTAVIPQVFTLTGLVQSWISGAVPNYGFAIVAASPGPNSSVTYGSAEEGPFKHPQMVVCYDIPCAGGCDDGDVCTDDSCDPVNGCVHAPGTGASCDDGDPNTYGDVCTAGVCAGAGSCGSCDDGNPCTNDVCDPVAGCTSTPTAGATCDDGDPATIADVCSAAGVCAGIVAVPVCTTIKRSTGGSVQDSWVSSGQTAANFGSATTTKVATSSLIARSLFRFDLSSIPTSVQVLSADMTIRQGAATISPTLEIHRVTASWAEATVTNVNFAGAYDAAVITSAPAIGNGSPANLTFSLASVAQGWVDGSLPNYGVAVLAAAPAPAGSITLSASEDIAASQPSLTVCYVATCTGGCDDADPCTNDACDPSLGCTHTSSSGAACDDGDPATTNDICNAGVCAGTIDCASISCDDGDPCTADVCDPITGCSSTPSSGAACDDGDPNTVGDICSAGVCAGTPSIQPICTTIKRSTGGSVQDTWVNSGQQLVNYGTAPTARVSSNAYVTRTLYQFDVSSIPALAQVVSADVKLAQAASTTTPNLEIHEVSAAWNELTLTNVIFANSYNPAILASFPAVGNNLPATLSFSVTSAAQNWIDGSSPNNGVVVLVTAPGPNGFLTLSTSEDIAANQPSLTVCYLLPCGTGCDDGNDCTADTCDFATGCSSAPLTGDICDDGDPNTLTDVCNAGVCVGLGPCGTGCDDGDPCTADVCDPVNGCSATPSSGAACDDGNPATVGDVCSVGVCAGTVVPQPNGGGCLVDTDCQSGSCTCGYCGSAPTWSKMSATNAPIARSAHASVWTGSKMIVWGGSQKGVCNPAAPNTLNTGSLYDPATDTWTPMSTVNAPAARSRASFLWLGAPFNKMFVWGGFTGCDQPTVTNTGGLYDPATDTWTATSLVNAPIGRAYQGAIWTGSKVIIFAGKDPNHLFQNTGGIYDPATNTWTPTTTIAAPGFRGDPYVGWTGTEMLAFGGFIPGHFIVNDGGLYNPLTDSWRAMTQVNAPSPRLILSPMRTMIDSGTELFAWGGSVVYWTFNTTNTGARYVKATDSWIPMTTVNAPQARDWQAHVWTGKHYLIWSGGDETGVPMNTGGVYNPVTDTWCATRQDATTPQGAIGAVGVWTGPNYAPLPNRMIVWGGLQTSCPNNSCNGIYQPGGL